MLAVPENARVLQKGFVALERDRLVFLAEASRLLASSLDYQETLRSIARLLIPQYADDSLVYLLEDGSARLMAEASVSPDQEALLRKLQREPVLKARSITSKVLETGSTIFAPEISESYFEGLSEGYRRILEVIRPRTMISVPISANNEVLGAITFGFTLSRRSYSQSDVLLAEELGCRAGLAIANARLYRRAQQAVRHLEGIISCTVDGILVADARGHVVLANDGAANVFGIAREKLLIPLAEYVTQFELRTADSGKPAAPIGIRALDGEVLEADERVIVRPSGEVRHLRESAAPLRDDNGKIEGAVMVVGDVTHLKQLERDRELLYEQSQKTAKMQQELLAIVSHDLKSPLSGILLQAETLLRAVPNDRRKRTRRQLEIIRRSAIRMDQMIRSLLDAASIEAGELSLELKAHHLGEIVDDALGLLEPLTSRKALKFETNIPAELPAVVCDREKIVRVLSNLVGNAIKFSPQGSPITVLAAARGGEVELAVRDQGPGITAEQIPHVFERFWRGKRSGQDGTGLGLYIAKLLVEAHRGRLWVQSGPVSGSSFFFTLPIALNAA